MRFWDSSALVALLVKQNQLLLAMRPIDLLNRVLEETKSGALA